MARGTRRTRALGALLASAALLVVGGCAGEEPPPPRERMVELDATGTSAPGATAFGRFVLLGSLEDNGARTFDQLPFSRTYPVPYVPQPKIQVSLVGVDPGSEVSCRIRIDGETVVEETADAPGETAVCSVG